MAEPFLGEIRLFAFGVVPRGWAPCEGQLLPIRQNAALYTLLGIQYGGDGQQTFALPDLRGRVPLHRNPPTFPQGQAQGEEAHTLTTNEMPRHLHQVSASSADANGKTASGSAWAKTAANVYSSGADVQMSPNAISTTGGSQAHSNMQPFVVASYCIALSGIFPPRD